MKASYAVDHLRTVCKCSENLTSPVRQNEVDAIRKVLDVVDRANYVAALANKFVGKSADFAAPEELDRRRLELQAAVALWLAEMAAL